MRFIAAVLGSMLLAAPVLAQTAPAPAQSAPAPGSSAPAVKTNQHQFEKRFDAANTTHDGRLTLAQAQAAKLHNVVRDFQVIDRGAKGYITKEDVHAHMRAKKTQQAPL